MPQTNTMSAKAGGIDVIEGAVFLDGQPFFQSARPKRFLRTDDVLSTGLGTAEIVLAPDVFLRVEDWEGDSLSRRVTKDTRLRIIDHGASVLVKKPGIYQFAADNPPVVDVIADSAYSRRVKAAEIGPKRPGYVFSLARPPS